uniref:FCP1 homology domain-containing protein n=1 Tax=Leersia perrieri TaxID=77586 RepID=A0A0D9WUP1_9ORYZ
MDRTPVSGKSAGSKRRRGATTATTSTPPAPEAEVEKRVAPAASAPVEETPKGKRSRSKKGNKRNQQQTPSAVTDATAVVIDTDLDNESRNGCTRGEGATTSTPAVPDVDDLEATAISASVEGTHKGKQTKVKKRKKHKLQKSPCAVSDASAAVMDTDLARNGCTSEEGALQDADVVASPRSGHDPTLEMDQTQGKSKGSKQRQGSATTTAAGPEVDEQEVPATSASVERTPKGKKSKDKKRKKNKEQQSPSAVSDASAAVTDTDLGSESGNGCTSLKVATTSMAAVPEVDKWEAPTASASVEGAQKQKQSKDKKQKKHKQQESPSSVSDASAVVTDTDLAKEFGNGCTCTGEEGALQNADVVGSTRSGHDPMPEMDQMQGNSKGSKRRRGSATSTAVALEVEKVDEREAPTGCASVEGTQKGKKLKSKKHKQQQSPSAVSHAGAVVTDTDLANESGNGCMSGEEATTSTVAVPEVEKEVDKREVPAISASVEGTEKGKKQKDKKRKRHQQQQSPSAVSDASAVVTDTDLPNESGNGCTIREGVSRDTDVIVSSTSGHHPECPEINNAQDLVAGKKESKDNNSQSCGSLNESIVERKRRKNRAKRRRKKENTNRRSNLQNLALQPGAGEVALVTIADGNNIPGSECKDSNKKRKRNQTSVPEASSVQRMNFGETGSVGMMDGEAQPFSSDIRHVKRDRSDVLSNFGQAQKEKYQHIYSPRGSLIRFRRKKLLILDINGLLADINQDHHNAHMSLAKVRGKLVFKRPYCDDFLSFCFQHFELGIWSSRMKVNVDSVLNIIMKNNMRHCLLFCWDLSKCTGTGCNTLGNKHKPLVLKELKKLWNKEDPDLPWEQGEFSPSNTLLVDDSPYKALANPPHTAIFPKPYSYRNKKDNSLGPGGDLRVYLENLATADDVQSYVQEHPFGQPSITKNDRHWNFYIHDTSMQLFMEQESIIEDRKAADAESRVACSRCSVWSQPLDWQQHILKKLPPDPAEIFNGLTVLTIAEMLPVMPGADLIMEAQLKSQ